MGKITDRSKETIIARLIETRQQILEAAVIIPVEKQNQAFVGEWSIIDMLAHLAGWDDTNLEGVQALIAGEIPRFFALRDRDWKTYNAMLVSRYKKDDLAQMIVGMRETQGRLLAFLKELSDDDFRRVVHVNNFRMSIGGLLNFEIRDEKEHLEQIRGFLNA